MTPLRLFLLTALAMMAFAGNSLLCRLALKQASIDAATFTAIRLVSGAIVLWLMASLRRERLNASGNWPSAIALFAYAACFSFAYVMLTAATGALLLFGAVQATMIGKGLHSGERLRPLQWMGLLSALGGLAWLMLPGAAAPPLTGSLLMITAGIAWGVYSLRGRTGGAALNVTTGNFLRAAPIAAALGLLNMSHASADTVGVIYAVMSGAVASGIGYAIWYTALPGLKATSAATVQLSVPVLAALGGIAFLSEPLSLRLVLASLAILGGIALVILDKGPTLKR
ncbi:MAG: DMT family transporter [Betaproteobacteria bacterium]